MDQPYIEDMMQDRTELMYKPICIVFDMPYTSWLTDRFLAFLMKIIFELTVQTVVFNTSQRPFSGITCLFKYLNVLNFFAH